MTDEIVAYMGWGISAQEQIDGLRREVRELRDENAKLRDQIHWLKKGDILHVLTDQEYIDQCERERLMQVSIDALDKENAKLRELARILVHCMNEVDNCYTCSINGNPYDVRAGNWAACDTLRDMLLDMGVEVDG